MRRHGILFAGFQECRQASAGPVVQDGVLRLSSPSPEGRGGCQLWADLHALPGGNMQQFSVHYRHPRLLVVLYQTGGLRIALVVGHAPDSTTPEEERAAWWELLKDRLHSLPPNTQLGVPPRVCGLALTTLLCPRSGEMASNPLGCSLSWTHMLASIISRSWRKFPLLFLCRSRLNVASMLTLCVRRPALLESERPCVACLIAHGTWMLMITWQPSTIIFTNASAIISSSLRQVHASRVFLPLLWNSYEPKDNAVADTIGARTCTVGGSWQSACRRGAMQDQATRLRRDVVRPTFRPMTGCALSTLLICSVCADTCAGPSSMMKLSMHVTCISKHDRLVRCN